MKHNEKIKAVKLRKRGKSYSEIAKILKVAKGTLSVWLKDIPLSKKQKSALKGLLRAQYIGAKANQKKAQTRRETVFGLAYEESKKLINDPLFLSGLMLYWAEGTKQGNTVAFSNSDPKMIALMMKWFRRICRVPLDKFRVVIYIHALLVNSNWKSFWAKITNIPKSQFLKHYVKPTITKHRRNKLYNGTCSIRISSVDLLNKIRGWNKGCQEILK